MNSFQDPLKLTTLFGVGAIFSAVAAASLYYRKEKQKLQIPPNSWKDVGTVDGILFFPVKSCAPIILESAECTNMGIMEKGFLDRALMLFDKTDRMVTARTYNRMLKIQPKIIGDGKLMLSAPGMEDIELDMNNIRRSYESKVEVWNSKVFVKILNEEVDKWFSRFILNKENGLRLAFYPYSVATRPILSPIFDNGIFLKSDTGTFFDVSSYMLIHENSVDELNTRLEERVEPLNFRGNFVIRTNQAPYAEDHWNWIRIGENTVFRSLAPCYRCIFPNINPHTAERNKENEPLKTLKSYRTWGKSKSPRFGIQMGVRQEGIVQKGDRVYVEGLEV